ncbi:MAG: metallophosphoesterase [Saprospiraceae bacterium]
MKVKNQYSLNELSSMLHLIEGRIEPFAETFIDSLYSINIACYTIERCLNSLKTTYNFSQGSLSNNLIDKLITRLYELRNEYFNILKNINSDDEKIVLKNKVITDEYFSQLVEIFKKCNPIIILIPNRSTDHSNSLFTNKDVYNDVVKNQINRNSLVIDISDNINISNLKSTERNILLIKALLNVDNWPGMLIKNNRNVNFVSVNSKPVIFNILELLNNGNRIDEDWKDSSFNESNTKLIFHLSDLHLGKSSVDKVKSRLFSLLVKIKSIFNSNFNLPIITGDILDKPSLKLVQQYDEFKNQLNNYGFLNPIIIPGNHDSHFSGFLRELNFLTNRSSLFNILFYKESNIIQFESSKLAIICFDSNKGGNIAGGKIGEKQFIDIGNEFDKLNLDDYFKIGILHHHPVQMAMPGWYIRDNAEELLGERIFESTMKLEDSHLLLEWLEKRDVKYILHGHKHIPNIKMHQGLLIVSGGSATGLVNHILKGKTYLSFNLIKFNSNRAKPNVFYIFKEELLGSGFDVLDLIVFEN